MIFTCLKKKKNETDTFLTGGRNFWAQIYSPLKLWDFSNFSAYLLAGSCGKF